MFTIPTAVSVFPDEIYAAPKSWTEKAYPKLIHYNRLPKGGHFAAWEQPELFAGRTPRVVPVPSLVGGWKREQLGKNRKVQPLAYGFVKKSDWQAKAKRLPHSRARPLATRCADSYARGY